jgi:hypothetical protein
MDEQMQALCDEHAVNYDAMVEKINNLYDQQHTHTVKAIRLSYEECQVLITALEIAGGL